jgi:hypothetical protein
MAIQYNNLYVDEKYSGILEPNLYYNSIFVPGATYSDRYQIGPAGGIFVHKPIPKVRENREMISSR